jgi:hypothetical protein
MIGLQRPGQGQANANEPAELRTLSKHALYNMLADQFLLPPLDSKGINRIYLVGVYANRNYRVPLMDFKRFEAELTPAQLKKTALVNMGYILRKLNALLRERGESGLGFPEFVIPEEAWLCKVARFVDRKNVMEFFGEALTGIQPITINSERIHHGRTVAFRYIFQGNRLLDNNKVFNAVKDISETYRRIISKRIDLEEMQFAQQTLAGKLAEEEGALKALLVRAATTIIAVANDQFDPEEIYVDGGENANVGRTQLAEMTKL